MMTDAKSQWQMIEVLEDDAALPEDQRKEFSYPYLITLDGNDAHLVYTWDRKKIHHRYFSGVWLKRAHSQLTATEAGNTPEETKQ
jgi:predicted neuraminidase